jgi:hypothetical protein
MLASFPVHLWVLILLLCGASLLFQKLWFQHVWPSLQQEMKTQEVLAAVLQPIIFLVQECTIEEYESTILPSFR